MNADLRSAIEPIRSHLDVARLDDWARTADIRLARQAATYIGEAVFFHGVLADDISQLGRGANIVEIGSGIGLLARLVAAAGHQVITFEPGTAGFDTLGPVRDLIRRVWTTPIEPPVEHCRPFDPLLLDGTPIDLVFGVNVIEHVTDPGQMLLDATGLLGPSGRARFICPNYAFPYEPHFGFATLWSKSITGRWHRRAIAESGAIPSPEAFWVDLSWPTQRGLRRVLTDAGVKHGFSRSCLLSYVGRLDDPAFTARKGWLFESVVTRLRSPLKVGLGFIPLAVAPIIDLTMYDQTQ